MKNSLLCALFVSAFFSANAQTGKNVEKGLFKVNALLPGASYELGTGNNTTLNFDALLAFALQGRSGRDKANAAQRFLLGDFFRPGSFFQ